jgi:precorrin-3B C17-methyltransferase
VGIGPGSTQHLTHAATEAIRGADVVVGYTKYLAFIKPLLENKKTVASGMKQEMERAQAAVDLASQGQKVVIISTGDAGIYGMAGLVLEILGARTDVDVSVVPGVTAASAAASVLGAPLMNDFAVISLSDLLTPRAEIERRLRAVADADFVTALYNPRSHKRVEPFEMAIQIFRDAMPHHIPVGIVRNALREEQGVKITTLGKISPADVDMMSVVIIGNSFTKVENGRMITARGYAVKKTHENEDS